MFPKPPKIVPPARGQSFSTLIYRRQINIQTVAFSLWLPEALGYLRMSNAFSPPPRVTKVLTVPILFKSPSPKSLLRFKANC
jgi:hypothetical protein